MLEINPNKYVGSGKRNSPTECPVALAALDAIKAVRKDIEGVAVLGDTITLTWKDGHTSECIVDKEVTEAIRKFDETGQAKFPKMVFGSDLEAVLNAALSGKAPNPQGNYRRKEGA